MSMFMFQVTFKVETSRLSTMADEGVTAIIINEDDPVKAFNEATVQVTATFGHLNKFQIVNVSNRGMVYNKPTRVRLPGDDIYSDKH